MRKSIWIAYLWFHVKHRNQRSEPSKQTNSSLLGPVELQYILIFTTRWQWNCNISWPIKCNICWLLNKAALTYSITSSWGCELTCLTWSVKWRAMLTRKAWGPVIKHIHRRNGDWMPPWRWYRCKTPWRWAWGSHPWCAVVRWQKYMWTSRTGWPRCCKYKKVLCVKHHSTYFCIRQD